MQWMRDTTARTQQHDCSGFPPDSLLAEDPIIAIVKQNLKPVIVNKCSIQLSSIIMDFV